MKFRFAALATATVALAAPAAASAAELVVENPKRCYGSGDRVTLRGTGFTPNNLASISAENGTLGSVPTSPLGEIAPTLRVGRKRGQGLQTYTATDAVDPTLTASAQLLVSMTNVGFKLKGNPGKLLRLNGVGFTSGKKVYAHIVRGRSVRTMVIAKKVKGACAKFRVKRRLFSSKPAVGLYRVQFDTERKYNKDTTNSDVVLVTIRRVFRPAAAIASAR